MTATAAASVANFPDGVHRASVEHAELLAEFFRKVWDPDATAAGVRAARSEGASSNPVDPGQEIPTFIFIKQGEVAAYVTSIPFRLWFGATDRGAHWVKGLMVLPEYRNGPVGFYVLKELVSVLDWQFAVAGADPAVRLFKALGYTDAGLIPNFVKLLRPTAVLRRLNATVVAASGLPRVAKGAYNLMKQLRLEPIAGALLRLATNVASLRGIGSPLGSAEMSNSLDPQEAQALWERTRNTFPASAARDSNHVRELSRSGADRYRYLILRDKGQMTAYAIVRTPAEHPDPRLGGIRLCTISDLVYPLDSPAVGERLLRECERAARQLGAHALLCSATFPALTSCLSRRAFVRVEGNIHFLFKCSSAASDSSLALQDWWLLRGDSQADATF